MYVLVFILLITVQIGKINATILLQEWQTVTSYVQKGIIRKHKNICISFAILCICV